MKRTIPGGRVESIYTQTKNGKEVIATTIIPEEVEEEIEEIEDLEATPIPEAEKLKPETNE